MDVSSILVKFMCFVSMRQRLDGGFCPKNPLIMWEHPCLLPSSKVSVSVQFSLCLLFDLEDKSLEIFALGVVDVDWVVGWLVQLMEDADVSAALCCCCEDCKTELVLIDSL